MYIPDNFDAFDRWEADQERFTKHRHYCDYCDEKVGEECYRFGYHYYCEECVKDCRFDADYHEWKTDRREVCSECQKELKDYGYDIDGFIYCEECLSDHLTEGDYEYDY